jgi:hypothetical protein
VNPQLAHGPSWTDVITALSTLGLFVATTALVIAAIWGGVTAIKQLKLLDDSERRKNTFALVREYTKAVDGLPSPQEAASSLRVMSSEHSSREIVRWYSIVRNYFDEVHDLHQRELIDEELYVTRHHPVIHDGISILRRFAAAVPTELYDEAMIRYLEEMTRHHRAHPESR